MTRNWDRRGSGSREFSDQDYARIVRRMQESHVGPRGLVRMEDLASECAGIGGRTIRSILSEADGREFVLYQGDDGVFIADSYDDTVGATRRIRSQAHRMAARVERRERYAAEHLPRVQAALW